MKILHLISGGDTGGAKTHVLSLIKELNKNVDAKIVCFIKDEFYYDGIKMGIDIEVVEQKKRYDLSIINRLKELIASEKYDIIHSHGARANFISVLLKTKGVRTPFITTIHSDYKLDFTDSLYKKFVYTAINEIALRFFNHYIAVSSRFKNMLQQRGFNGDKIFTVYNGIDTEQKIEVCSKGDFLSRYEIPYNNEIIIGIAGRLDQVKNHEVFIKAAEKILSKRKDVSFLIAGLGSEEKRLKTLVIDKNIEDHVHFLGFVKDPFSFFNAIDINVLTSISESFPYVILEGAIMKKTVVSTDVGGLNDLIENGVNGYLFDVGDYKQLAIYLEELINNMDKTKAMGQNLCSKVEEKFSLKKMGIDHLEIYNKIINNRRS